MYIYICIMYIYIYVLYIHMYYIYTYHPSPNRMVYDTRMSGTEVVCPQNSSKSSAIGFPCFSGSLRIFPNHHPNHSFTASHREIRHLKLLRIGPAALPGDILKVLVTKYLW